jgi:hypothetical protein
MKKSRKGSKPGIFGKDSPGMIGAPKMGAMQTPARLAKTRKSGGRAMSGKR